jgi:hypothetical protein
MSCSPSVRGRWRRPTGSSPRSNAPLAGPDDALRVVFTALDEPRRPETIVLLLDDDHRGSVVLLVSDVGEPSEVRQLVALLVEVARTSPTLRAVVLATSRPGGGVMPAGDDEQAFATMRHDLAEAGVELVDWFLVDEDRAGSVAELSGACWLWRGPEPAW